MQHLKNAAKYTVVVKQLRRDTCNGKYVKFIYTNDTLKITKQCNVSQISLEHYSYTVSQKVPPSYCYNFNTRNTIVAKRLDASGCRPKPWRRFVRWGHSLYPKRGGAPPNFRPTSTVVKRLNGSRCHLIRR